MTHRLSLPARAGAFTLAAAILLTPAAAAAQASADLIYLQDRVERLEARLQLLGLREGTPQSAGGGDASLAMRVGELEEQVRRLHGQVEDLVHAMRRIEMQTGSSGRMPDYGSNPQTRPTWEGGQPRIALDPVEPERRQIGNPPQILGQIPGQPLDLSGALGESMVDYGGRTTGTFGGSSSVDYDRAPGQEGAEGGMPQFAAVPTGNARDDYDQAYGHVLRGNFDAAEAGFRQFLTNHSGDELAGNAQYWLGESLFARGRYRDAADAFLAGYTDYPDGSKAPDSLFKLGMSLKELGQREAACSALEEIGRRYPDAPQAVRERSRSEMDRSGC